MAEKMRLAVPTNGKAGLEAGRGVNFVHCDCFTIVDVEDGDVTSVSELVNAPDDAASNSGPVELLANAGVDTIIVPAIGLFPLMGFKERGMTVLFDNTTPYVGDVVAKAIAGELEEMGLDAVCRVH